jgi:hypothetical protein
MKSECAANMWYDEWDDDNKRIIDKVKASSRIISYKSLFLYQRCTLWRISKAHCDGMKKRSFSSVSQIDINCPNHQLINEILFLLSLTKSFFIQIKSFSHD